MAVVCGGKRGLASFVLRETSNRGCWVLRAAFVVGTVAV